MSSTARDAYRPLQDGLRAAGRYLDQQGRRLVSLLVVDDGIVVTLAPLDIHNAGEAILLTHDDLRALSVQAHSARGGGNAPRASDPMFPTGYEDFLRALGAEAARNNWMLLRLVRLGDLAVARHGPHTMRQEVALQSKDVESILNLAFSQRGRGTSP